MKISKKKTASSLIAGTIALSAIVCPVSSVFKEAETQPAVIQMIDADAASYSLGTYKVNTKSGVNVRKGAGTNYGKSGAATNGTSFTVSKISGSWGYTNSIKCTNGTKSGWVCLDYAKIINSSTASNQSNSNVSSSYVITYSKSRNGNQNLSKNFKVKEFACRDGSDTIKIDRQLVDYLQKIRDHYGKAVNITSGYRTASYNKELQTRII